MENFYFEQYKTLLTSLEHDETRRETINQVWLVINSFGLSALTLFKETNEPVGWKDSILFTIIALIGMVLCIAWFLSIKNIKDKIAFKRSAACDLEEALGKELHQKINTERKVSKHENIVALCEIIVPSLFFLAYLPLIVLLLIFGFQDT